MHPRDLSIQDFKYHLPDEKIARFPVSPRDASKLLVCSDNSFHEDIFLHLENYLPPESLLILNETKVIEARLLFQKQTGGMIELFCLEPDNSYPDISLAMGEKKKVRWKCLVGGAKKWNEEVLSKHLETVAGELTLNAIKVAKLTDHFLVDFSWEPDTVSFAEILHAAGLIPLPPYLGRAAEDSDKQNYQTVYAKYDGSVAAPTAGLHFTERLFHRLEEKKFRKDFVTLHVGAGTFKPVKSEKMEHHEMHAEYIEIKKDLIENLAYNLSNSIIAVGTTSLRTLESLYWLGVKIESITDFGNDLIKHPGEVSVLQWDPYDLPQNTLAETALNTLLRWMDKNHRNSILTKTQIIIAPGYKPKIVKGLITNFHQPQSTLLLLVAALAGNNWKKIYDYALKHDFRFLSYGDGCLILC